MHKYELNITSETMIPDLLEAYPQSRAVLDDFGLRGCGGPRGPHESLGYFARAHGLDESKVLAQISSAINSESIPGRAEDATPASNSPEFADTIYRPFFIAGILTILTLGATWGALLLWRISFGGTFKAATAVEINAHAQAQVYGWMGFFIMGFAYQAFPRFWHTTLIKPRLAALVFSLLVSGVLLASIAMPFSTDYQWARALASCASLAELLSVALFSLHLFMTFKASGKAFEPYIVYVFTALFWFVVSSMVNLCLTFAAAKEMPLFYTNVCQPALRDMQFHGLGMTLILGVSLRTLPALFGLPAVSAPLAVAGLIMLTFGVLAEIAGLILAQSLTPMSGLLLMDFSRASILAACLTIVLPFRLWRKFPDSDRVEKFIRAAFLWLIISLSMLVASPLYVQVSGIESSHAYAGAVRHAITVGFISLMIMGYSAKVVPTLNGIDARKQTGLILPFLLVNTGCLLRVVLQTATDWQSEIFPLLGVSGSLEVLGMAIWAAHLLRILLSAPSSLPGQLPPAPQVITPDCTVANVLDWFPQTKSIFLANGFTGINNPVLRKTVASQISIARACRMQGTDEERFLAQLNEAIKTKH